MTSSTRFVYHYLTSLYGCYTSRLPHTIMTQLNRHILELVSDNSDVITNCHNSAVLAVKIPQTVVKQGSKLPVANVQIATDLRLFAPKNLT